MLLWWLFVHFLLWWLFIDDSHGHSYCHFVVTHYCSDCLSTLYYSGCGFRVCIKKIVLWNHCFVSISFLFFSFFFYFILMVYLYTPTWQHFIGNCMGLASHDQFKSMQYCQRNAEVVYVPLVKKVSDPALYNFLASPYRSWYPMPFLVGPTELANISVNFFFIFRVRRITKEQFTYIQ